MNEQKINLQVNVPENLRGGVAANIAFVTVTSNGEAILDFIFAHPNDKKEGDQQSTLVSRIILPVKVAKDFNLALSSLLGKAQKE